MKNTKYYTVETFPESNNKILERDVNKWQGLTRLWAKSPVLRK